MKRAGAVFLGFVAVSVAAGALWVANRSVTPRDASWQDVEAQAASGGYGLSWVGMSPE